MGGIFQDEITMIEALNAIKIVKIAVPKKSQSLSLYAILMHAAVVLFIGMQRAMQALGEEALDYKMLSEVLDPRFYSDFTPRGITEAYWFYVSSSLKLPFVMMPKNTFDDLHIALGTPC